MLFNGGTQELPTERVTGTDIHGIVEEGLGQRERQGASINYPVPTSEGATDPGTTVSGGSIELLIAETPDGGYIVMRTGPSMINLTLQEAAQLGQGLLIACGQLREKLNNKSTTPTT